MATADNAGANAALYRGECTGNMASTAMFVEPMTGIEPAYSAWEADVLPLNYIGRVSKRKANTREAPPGVRSDRTPGEVIASGQSGDAAGSGVIGACTETVVVAPLELVAVIMNVSSGGVVLKRPGPVE